VQDLKHAQVPAVQSKGKWKSGRGFHVSKSCSIFMGIIIEDGYHLSALISHIIFSVVVRDKKSSRVMCSDAINNHIDETQN
jgi:hypothetical protein